MSLHAQSPNPLNYVLTFAYALMQVAPPAAAAAHQWGQRLP